MKPWFGKNAVKTIVFYTIILTILACSAIAILTIWDILDPEQDQVALKTLMTVLSISATSLLLCLTNWIFLSANDGAYVQPPTNSVDGTPLSRALHKAKIERETRTEEA